MSDTQKHNKPNVPNLRFPEFSGEWIEEKLGKLVEIRSGISPTGIVSGNGNYPFYKVEQLNNCYIELESTPYKTENATIPQNSIVFPKRGAAIMTNKIRITSRICQLDTNLMALTVNKGINYKYIYYYIERCNLSKIADTSAIPQINNKHISPLKIYIPSFNEQSKITTLLTYIDERIYIQNKVIKDLIRIKESITRKLLRQKDESSRIVTLGEITEIVSRRNKDRKNYPMYSVTNDRGFIPQTEQFEDREMVGDDIGNYKIIHKDEIAYNPARINVGSIAQYTEEKPCMISSLYVCIRAKKGINSKWLIRVLKSEQLIKYYNLYAEGGVRLYLFYPNFSRIKVLLPSNAMQQQIADTLETIENKIELESSILKDYILSKEALLDSMFI